MDGPRVRDRVEPLLAGMVGGFLLILASGCDSKSGGERPEKSAGTQETEQTQGKLKKKKKKEEDDREVPEKEPGWTATLSGPVRAEVGGPSVLRKHAGPSGKKQIVLAGPPAGEPESDDEMMFVVSELGPDQTETKLPEVAEARFGKVALACKHPVQGDVGGETKFEVSFKSLSEARIEGTFSGTMYCESTADDENEGKFVEVEGEFFDP